VADWTTISALATAGGTLDEFGLLTRDIYIPPGKTGFWQIAFRDESPQRGEMLAAVGRGAFSVQLLYGD